MTKQTLLLVFLILYVIFLLLLAFIDKANNFTDFAVAGKRQKSSAVTLSILATVVGGSATIGIIDTTYSIGFPAVWWLFFGGIGLILQGLFISKKVRSLNADTLPDAAGKLVNRPAEIVISLIIVISWIGVIAGQLIALNNIISLLLGSSSKPVFVVVSLAVIAYTTIGGQLSVVKTDMLQFLLVVLGILFTLCYLYLFKGDANQAIFSQVELLNGGYQPINLFTQLFVIGGVYFLGPDIMSRNLLSKDSKTAKKSALISGCALFFYTIVIVLIGMWAKFHIAPEQVKQMGAFMSVIEKVLPFPVKVIMVIGLISAVLSSIDTCIINAATIFVRDLLKKQNVNLIRLTVVVLGALALVFALSGSGDIIKVLQNAYSVYTPGVIFPLTIAILSYEKHPLNKNLWLSAVICGGLFGILGSYGINLVTKLSLPAWFSSNMSLIGMFLSLILALCSVNYSKKINN